MERDEARAKGPWRFLPAVRGYERERFTFFFLLTALLSLAQMVGLAGAEALFLARLGAEALPEAFVVAAALTVAASLLYAWRVGEERNDRVFVELLVLAALAVGLSAAAAAAGSVWGAPALFCLFWVTQGVLLNHLWTFVGDFFDTLASKRVVPLFTVGSSVGGALGGAAALGLSRQLPTEALAFAWAALLGSAAVLIAVQRTRLQGWRTLAAEEEDETSVAGIRAALRYVQRSALGRWLVVSSLTMVLALFVSQYLYSDVLARAYPDPAELARFLGAFLAVTNGVEAVLELWVTPLLIRRFGVPTAHLVHPATSMISLAALGLDYRLPAALVARANRELVENAIGQPVRNLVYNALPVRFRARMRAFLEGIVVYGGMSLAGAVLLLAGDLEPRLLCWAGLGLAGLYALANLRVRRAYLDALVTELRAGRLDLREVGDELGPRELAELARLWNRVLEEEAEPGRAVLELAPTLVEHGEIDAVIDGVSHPSPTVRALCLEALGAADRAVPPEPWIAGLADREARVRCAAARSLPDDRTAAPPLHAALQRLLSDPDPAARASAARKLGSEGEAALREMLGHPAPEPVLAALASLPDALIPLAMERVVDPDPRVRAAAVRSTGRVASPAGMDLAALEAALSDPDLRVRRAAAEALSERAEPGSAAPLVRALEDPAQPVRTAAVRGLSARGPEGAAAALPVLRAPAESSVAAALAVLGSSPAPEARAALRRDYALRVREAWDALLASRALSDPAPRDAFLRLAWNDAFARSVRLAYRALAGLEEAVVVRSVERALRFTPGRVWADALEVLSNLGDRETSRWLVLLLEPIPVEEKLGALGEYTEPVRDASEARARARRSSAPWVRLAAFEIEEGGGIDPAAAEAIMERLLSLRRVSLFSQLSLERLQAIERITRQAEYVKGEVIVREGAPGEELYLLVEGDVDVLRDVGSAAETRVNRMGPGSYFGEIAVLDGSPRTATIVAASDVRVLVLDGGRLRELIHEVPEIAFEIFRVLTERIRSAEQRASAG